MFQYALLLQQIIHNLARVVHVRRKHHEVGGTHGLLGCHLDGSSLRTHAIPSRPDDRMGYILDRCGQCIRNKIATSPHQGIDIHHMPDNKCHRRLPPNPLGAPATLQKCSILPTTHAHTFPFVTLCSLSSRLAHLAVGPLMKLSQHRTNPPTIVLQLPRVLRTKINPHAATAAVNNTASEV